MCEGGTGGRRQVSPLSPRATQIKTTTRIQAEQKEREGITYKSFYNDLSLSLSLSLSQEAERRRPSPICSALPSFPWMSPLQFRQCVCAETIVRPRPRPNTLWHACQAAAFKAAAATSLLVPDCANNSSGSFLPSFPVRPCPSVSIGEKEGRHRHYQVTPTRCSAISPLSVRVTLRRLREFGIGLQVCRRLNSFESPLYEQADRRMAEVTACVLAWPRRRVATEETICSISQ